jgi:hypothetical protein
MRVKVGANWFDATTEEPVMVVLTQKEKADIANMAPDATMYAVFVDDCAMSSNERLSWMTQPDPATALEGRRALMTGHPIPLHQADTLGVDELPRKSNNELAWDVMRPVLKTAGRRLLQTLEEIDKTRILPLETALKAIIAKPHGCIYCDYGELRRPPKFPDSDPNNSHDDDCGYAMAAKLIGPQQDAPK